MQIAGANELKKFLAEVGERVLPHIAPAVSAEAGMVAVTASVTEPRGTGDLATSKFTDGPRLDSKALSVGSTVGYESPHAPYAHEGFHYGKKVSEPPKWLQKAADGRAPGFAKAVGAAIRTGLEKLKS